MNLGNLPTRVATGAYILGIGISKDVWMLGIGLGLVVDGLRQRGVSGST